MCQSSSFTRFNFKKDFNTYLNICIILQGQISVLNILQYKFASLQVNE